jgi:hypothetical protein
MAVDIPDVFRKNFYRENGLERRWSNVPAVMSVPVLIAEPFPLVTKRLRKYRKSSLFKRVCRLRQSCLQLDCLQKTLKIFFIA